MLPDQQRNQRNQQSNLNATARPFNPAPFNVNSASWDNNSACSRIPFVFSISSLYPLTRAVVTAGSNPPPTSENHNTQRSKLMRMKKVAQAQAQSKVEEMRSKYEYENSQLKSRLHGLQNSMDRADNDVRRLKNELSKFDKKPHSRINDEEYARLQAQLQEAQQTIQSLQSKASEHGAELKRAESDSALKFFDRLKGMQNQAFGQLKKNMERTYRYTDDDRCIKSNAFWL